MFHIKQYLAWWSTFGFCIKTIKMYHSINTLYIIHLQRLLVEFALIPHLPNKNILLGLVIG